MKVLLDTCEFLWLVSGDAKLTAAVSAAVRDPNLICTNRGNMLNKAALSRSDI